MAELHINGKPLRADDVAPDTPLLYVLRNDAGLDGVRFGCGAGQCGACAVLLDGREVLSCLTTVAAAADASITTIEGLGTPQAPHPVQAAFLAEQAAQCGYCTPGMIIAATSLLAANAAPSEAEIRSAMARHLCRCGSYDRIVRAVQRAAAMMAS